MLNLACSPATKLRSRVFTHLPSVLPAVTFSKIASELSTQAVCHVLFIYGSLSEEVVCINRGGEICEAGTQV